MGSSPIFRRKKEIRNCFRRDSSGFFYCMGNCVPDAIKTSGGGALRAEENGCRRSRASAQCAPGAHVYAREMTKRIGFCRLPSEKRGSGSGQQNRYTSVLQKADDIVWCTVQVSAKPFQCEQCDISVVFDSVECFIINNAVL